MVTTITTDGEKVLARIPYAQGEGPTLAKKVPGARWDPEDKVWKYPLTLDTCRTFRRVFGAALEVLPPLAAYARAALAREAALDAYRDGRAVSLDRTRDVAPELYAAMDARPYQLMGASFGAQQKQFCLGDKPGLGKTLQTLATLTEANCQNILVGCPRTAAYTVWWRETRKWTPEIWPVVAQGDRGEREDAMYNFLESAPPRMLIINNEMVRCRRLQECQIDGRPRVPWKSCDKDHEHKTVVEPWWPFLFDQEWDAIILDESHHLLASTYNVQSDHITQGRYGAMHLRKRLAYDGLAIALSGTPFRSNLTKSWGTMNWLRPDVFTSYWNFAATHFGVEEERKGRRIVKVVAQGAKVPKPLDQAAFDAAIRPYYLARTKEDAAPDLPPISYAGTLGDNSAEDGLKAVWLQLDPKQRKAYDDIVEDAETKLPGGKLLVTGVLAEITRMRQLACSYGRMEGRNFIPDLPSNKLEWLIEFALENQGNDDKILVASEFTELLELSANAVGNELHEPVLLLSGKTTDANRRLFQEKFNNVDDPARVGFINTKAGGESITLDTCCDNIVLLDTPWTADAEEQVVSRIHRVSRPDHKVMVWRLASEDTVDQWMAELTAEQRAVLFAAHPRDAATLAKTGRITKGSN